MGSRVEGSAHALRVFANSQMASVKTSFTGRSAFGNKRVESNLQGWEEWWGAEQFPSEAVPSGLQQCGGSGFRCVTRHLQRDRHLLGHPVCCAEKLRGG